MNEKEFDEFIKPLAAEFPESSITLRLMREAFEAGMRAQIDPAPPPQVLRGEGVADNAQMLRNIKIVQGYAMGMSALMGGGEIDATLMQANMDIHYIETYQANVEKLAGLVNTYIAPGGLRGTTPPHAVDEIRRLAALLAPKAPAP